MARNRFIKTHSNYVIKELHQVTNIGNIYERDFMTISDLNSYAPGSLPAYGLNGFKMVVNDSISLKKKHHFGNWLKNDACGIKTMYWSMQCMEDTDVDDNNEIVLKPNLNSVLDFACYGSTSKMIESSVKNIINTYPAELYLTDIKVDVNGTKLFLVDNPFNIEMDKFLLIDEKVDNPLRIFSESYKDYVFYDENETTGRISWDVTFLNQNPCRREYDELSMIDLGYPFGEEMPKVLLYYYIFNGKKVLFHDGSYTNARISPNNKVIKNFFNNLDFFEKVLLNKKTNYTAILETPKETAKGNVMYRKPYTWPKTKFGSWNIDVSSSAFLAYFDSLLNIGDF